MPRWEPCACTELSGTSGTLRCLNSAQAPAPVVRSDEQFGNVMVLPESCALLRDNMVLLSHCKIKCLCWRLCWNQQLQTWETQELFSTVLSEQKWLLGHTTMKYIRLRSLPTQAILLFCKTEIDIFLFSPKQSCLQGLSFNWCSVRNGKS